MNTKSWRPVSRGAGWVAVSVWGWLLAGALLAQVPPLIHYQGRIIVDSTNFTGTGQFRFALVDGPGSNTYWSNGTTVVSIPVTKGLYAVLLGDAGMNPIPASVFTNADVRLRVWFNDAVAGLQQLSPDQRIGAVGYAMNAAQAQMAANVVPLGLGSNSLGSLVFTGTSNILSMTASDMYAVTDGRYPGFSDLSQASDTVVNTVEQWVGAQNYLTRTNNGAVVFTNGQVQVLVNGSGQFAGATTLRIVTTGASPIGGMQWVWINPVTGLTNVYERGWDWMDPLNVSYCDAFVTPTMTADQNALFVTGPYAGAQSHGARTASGGWHSFFCPASGTNAGLLPPTMYVEANATTGCALTLGPRAGNPATIFTLDGLQWISTGAGQWLLRDLYQGTTNGVASIAANGKVVFSNEVNAASIGIGGPAFGAFDHVISLTGHVPGWAIKNTMAAANQGTWYGWVDESGNYRLWTVSDDLDSVSNVMVITRSGINPTAVIFNAPIVAPNLVSQSNLNATPAIQSLSTAIQKKDLVIRQLQRKQAELEQRVIELERLVKSARWR